MLPDRSYGKPGPRLLNLAEEYFRRINRRDLLALFKISRRTGDTSSLTTDLQRWRTLVTRRTLIDEATSIPKVTIITPLYNSADLIRETLDSVLSQTYANWELILVDDGSTDDTRQVIGAYLDDPRFKYIRQENAGIAEARNTGVSVARGEWVCPARSR